MYLIANFLLKKRNSTMNNVDVGQIKDNAFGKSKKLDVRANNLFQSDEYCLFKLRKRSNSSCHDLLNVRSVVYI